jgi:hypothetical protein
MTFLRLPSRAPAGFVPPVPRPVLVLLLSLALGVVPLRAQSADTAIADEHHPVRPAAGEVEVDGRLDEDAWREAEPIRLAWEVSPGENAPAPVETVCRVTYDEDALYFACRARDPEPEEIRARLADRDTPFGDDHVTILLDTFGDRRRGYQFRVTALGVQMDALFDRGSESFAWDGIWESAGRITDDGYVVEAAVPFRTLTFPQAEGPQEWGVIFARSWPRSQRHRIRSIRTDYDQQCLLCQAQRLTGLVPGSPGRGIELNPTLTSTRTDRRREPGAPGLESGAVEVEPGFTGSWQVSSNLNLSATANPDFSQVEADAARLESNRRFALFFPEKRPFFLERSDIFRLPGNLVFTRTVVDPVAGVRLTGKHGANTLGAYLTRDRVTSLLFPGPRSSDLTQLDRDVTGLVGRWVRDIGRSSSVGLTVTDREGSGYHNRMVASDGDFQVSSSTSLGYLVAGTQTDYPDDVAEAFGQPTGDFFGRGAAVFGSHSTRDWFVNLSLVDVGPEFRADAGFLPQAGIREANSFWQRRFWTPDLSWATRFLVDGSLQYSEDHDGRLLRRGGDVELKYEGPLQSEASVEVGWQEEAFGGRTFSLPRRTFEAGLEPSGALELSGSLTAGKAIDFANARRADRLRWGADVTWEAGRHLRLEAGHDRESLSRGGESFLEESVTELRGVWHFSVEAFLRAVLQHRITERDPAAFGGGVASEREGLFGQFLFSYELNPRTALFVGYTDDRSGMESAERSLDLRPTRRTFFLKMSYAWRL